MYRHDYNYYYPTTPGTGSCPHCGYCPTCGRRNGWNQPYWSPYITWTVSDSTDGTTDGIESSCKH